MLKLSAGGIAGWLRPVGGGEGSPRPRAANVVNQRKFGLVCLHITRLTVGPRRYTSRLCVAPAIEWVIKL